MNYSNSTTTASICLGRSVNLTADPNDVFTGGVSLHYEFGYDHLEFDHININLVYQLKGMHLIAKIITLFILHYLV